MPVSGADLGHHDRPGSRDRLRAVPDHPTSGAPARRHADARIDRQVRSLPPAARSCSPGGPWSSRCCRCGLPASPAQRSRPCLGHRGRGSGARRDHPASRPPGPARAPDRLAVVARRSCANASRKAGIWTRWAGFVHRRPVWVTRRCPGGPGPADHPAPSLELGQEDVGATSPETTERKAYDLITAGSESATTGPCRSLRARPGRRRQASEYTNKYDQAQSMQKRAGEGADGAAEGAERSRSSSSSSRSSSANWSEQQASLEQQRPRAAGPATPAPGAAGELEASSPARAEQRRLEAEQARLEAERTTGARPRPRSRGAGPLAASWRGSTARAGAASAGSPRPRPSGPGGAPAGPARPKCERRRSRCATARTTETQAEQLVDRAGRSAQAEASWRRPRLQAADTAAPGHRLEAEAASSSGRRPNSSARPTSCSGRATRSSRRGMQLQAAGRRPQGPAAEGPAAAEAGREAAEAVDRHGHAGRRRPPRYRPPRRRPPGRHSPLRRGVSLTPPQINNRRRRAAVGRPAHRARHRRDGRAGRRRARRRAARKCHGRRHHVVRRWLHGVVRRPRGADLRRGCCS